MVNTEYDSDGQGLRNPVAIDLFPGSPTCKSAPSKRHDLRSLTYKSRSSLKERLSGGPNYTGPKKMSVDTLHGKNTTYNFAAATALLFARSYAPK